MFFRRKRNQDTESVDPQIVIDPFQGDPEARALSEALGARDWPRALHLIECADPVRQGWLVGIASSKRDVVTFIDDLIATAPRSAALYTVKGLAYLDWAWEARGSGWAKDVARDAWQVVNDRLRQAEDFLDEAVDLDPAYLPARTALITMATTRGKSTDEKLRRFDAAARIDPLNVRAHRATVVSLTKKWGGSSELMFAFARDRAAVAPDGHDLPVLVADAHVEEWLIRDRETAYLEQREVGDELVAAAHRSYLHPGYRYQHGVTPSTWNTFAFPLALGDRYTEAQTCFDRIGDALVTEGPWHFHSSTPGRAYHRLREYVASNLAG